EKELEVQLIVRTGKDVYPTSSGKELFIQAQNILNIRDEAINRIKGIDSKIKKDISIVASSVPAQYLLPRLIADFQKDYSNVLFHVHQTDSYGVIEELNGPKYDFGITGANIQDMKIEVTPFYKDQLVLIVPATLVGKEKLSVDDLFDFLKEQPFVMREKGSGTRQQIEKMLKAKNIDISDLNIKAYFQDTQSIVSAVSQGMGISFVSENAVIPLNREGKIRMIPLEEESRRQFYLALRKDLLLSPIAQIFFDYLINYRLD